MRIITGKHKGRKLYTLEGMNTRPMMDRMKESIFNIIGPFFDDDIVLDLFGGSGALSLEAISRGASFSYIVEKHGEAIKIIKKNIELLNEQNKINIMATDYQLALEYFKKNNQSFNIIFLDPPYRLKIIDEILAFILENKLLSSFGYIICQYQRNTHIPKENEYIGIIKHYNYANSEVTIYQSLK